MIDVNYDAAKAEQHTVNPWWRHKMETFSALLAICAGIHRSRWFPHTKASDAELWCFPSFDLRLKKTFE